MNLEFFIARRLISSKEYKSSVSAPIIKIAITAIALGMIMMMIAMATGVGLRKKIQEKIAAFNGHIQITNFDSNNSEVSLHPISTQQDFYPEFTSVKGITHIQAVANKAGIIRTAETFEGVIAKGVGNDYNWHYLKEYLVDGRLPNYSGNLNSEVLLSSYLANRLQFKVGDEFFTFFLKNDGSEIPNQRKFTLVGIYDSGYADFDATYMFTDIRHIQRMNKWEENQVGSFEVFIDNFDELEQKGNEVYGKTLSTLDSQTIKDKYYTVFEWIRIFDFNIAIIIGIMILVGGINMITALLVLILERTQMIGVLKALGSSNWSIRKLFLYNASYLILLGLLWGNLIGLTLLFLQKKFGFIRLDPASYYVTEAPVFISPLYIIGLNVGVLLLCLAMLLVPSYIIAKISPARSIKFE